MIDFFRLTPQQLDQFIHTQAIIERQSAAGERVRALREYYAGEHPVLLTQRQQEFLGGLVAADAFPFAHNLMRSVVDTLTERLSVQGVAVNGVTLGASGEAQAEAPTPDAQLSATLWAWWKGNRLDLAEQTLYANALVDGSAFVMVDYDAEQQRPRIVGHRVDDGTVGIIVHRDPDDPSRVLFATRYFYTYDPLRPAATGVQRKTVYLPHEIRKYKQGAAYASGGMWQPVQDDGDTSWPLPWLDRNGQPLGVPVIEFANPGGSEIAQIVGLQNALNKAWLDLIAAADQSGFPMLVAEYAAGTQLSSGDDDEDLEGTDELRIAPGRMLELSGGTLRRIEAANLTPMLDVIWALVAAVSGISRTPQYYLRPVGGDVPSGEALKQLESGLVARAVKRQRVFGQAWEDTFDLSMRIADAFGPFTASEPPSLEVQWADAETRNEMVMAGVAEAHKRLGVPDEQNWLTLGFTPEQIAGFHASAQQQRAQQVAGIAAALRTQQTGTQVPGENNGGANRGIRAAGPAPVNVQQNGSGRALA